MPSPVLTYRSATFQPNKPNNITKATSFIIGEATRNEKVTPNGTPASTNPRNKGIALQVQKGVIIPSKEAKTFPDNSLEYLNEITRLMSYEVLRDINLEEIENNNLLRKSRG